MISIISLVGKRPIPMPTTWLPAIGHAYMGSISACMSNIARMIPQSGTAQARVVVPCRHIDMPVETLSAPPRPFSPPLLTRPFFLGRQSLSDANCVQQLGQSQKGSNDHERITGTSLTPTIATTEYALLFLIERLSVQHIICSSATLVTPG